MKTFRRLKKIVDLLLFGFYSKFLKVIKLDLKLFDSHKKCHLTQIPVTKWLQFSSSCSSRYWNRRHRALPHLRHDLSSLHLSSRVAVLDEKENKS
jgi:hypothetical protein